MLAENYSIIRARTKFAVVENSVKFLLEIITHTKSLYKRHLYTPPLPINTRIVRIIVIMRYHYIQTTHSPITLLVI